jgi:signal transduction histidine kinase
MDMDKIKDTKDSKRLTEGDHGESALTRGAELRESAILQSIADGVVVSDSEGLVAFFNEAAARMLRMTSQVPMEEAVGQSAHEFFKAFKPRSPLTITQVMDQLYADPYTTGQEEGGAQVIIAAGPRVIRAHLAPILTPVGAFEGVVTTLHDITKEVNTERARSDLILDVSHELGAPLTAIRGYSDMLLRQTSDHLDHQQKHFLQIIRRNSDRLVALINDLMDINRVVSNRLELKLRPIQLEKVVQEVAEQMQAQCDQKGIHLSVEIEPNVGLVLGDEKRLKQLISNLTNDAWRRTPEGEEITLALSCSEGSVKVTVTDMGESVAFEDHEEDLQYFYRLGASIVSDIKGTGLELPIAKMLAEMHGGRLSVTSKPRRGNTFILLLPLHADMSGYTPTKEVEITDEKYTVLVVEDDIDTLDLIALQLQQNGFDVLKAEQGQKALELARTEDIDLVTLDIMLPDITGMDVLRQLKSKPETSGIPVIIVSVLQPDINTDGTGAADHITKPFTLERLMESIRRTLAIA